MKLIKMMDMGLCLSCEKYLSNSTKDRPFFSPDLVCAGGKNTEEFLEFPMKMKLLRRRSVSTDQSNDFMRFQTLKQK